MANQSPLPSEAQTELGKAGNSRTQHGEIMQNSSASTPHCGLQTVRRAEKDLNEKPATLLNQNIY